MLLILNYMDFQEHTSSNTEVINNYSLRDEDLNNIRIPAVAGLFYPADIYQLSNAVDGYLSQAGTGGISRPRIVVVPHAGYKYSAQIAAGAYKKLLPFQKDIKKITALCDEVEVLLNNHEDHTQKDIEFHAAIALSSKNVVVPRLIPVINSSIPLFVESTGNTLHKETIETHREIADAIAAHDPLRAQDAMYLHLVYNRKRIYLAMK